MKKGEVWILAAIVFAAILAAGAVLAADQTKITGFAPRRLRHKPAPCIKHKLGDKAKVCKHS